MEEGEGEREIKGGCVGRGEGEDRHAGSTKKGLAV
jgi:hypothetical protein